MFPPGKFLSGLIEFASSYVHTLLTAIVNLTAVIRQTAGSMSLFCGPKWFGLAKKAPIFVGYVCIYAINMLFLLAFLYSRLNSYITVCGISQKFNGAPMRAYFAIALLLFLQLAMAGHSHEHEGEDLRHHECPHCIKLGSIDIASSLEPFVHLLQLGFDSPAALSEVDCHYSGLGLPETRAPPFTNS